MFLLAPIATDKGDDLIQLKQGHSHTFSVV